MNSGLKGDGVMMPVEPHHDSLVRSFEAEVLSGTIVKKLSKEIHERRLSSRRMIPSLIMASGQFCSLNFYNSSGGRRKPAARLQAKRTIVGIASIAPMKRSLLTAISGRIRCRRHFPHSRLHRNLGTSSRLHLPQALCCRLFPTWAKPWQLHVPRYPSPGPQ